MNPAEVGTPRLATITWATAATAITPAVSGLSILHRAAKRPLDGRDPFWKRPEHAGGDDPADAAGLVSGGTSTDGTAAQLPTADAGFDAVVVSGVLCSVADRGQVTSRNDKGTREVRGRVLDRGFDAYSDPVRLVIR